MCNYLENKPEMSTPARVWTLGVVLLEAGDLQQFTVRAVFLHLIYPAFVPTLMANAFCGVTLHNSGLKIFLGRSL